MSRKDEHLIDTISVLVSVIDTRDENSNGHSIHIERLASLFYDELPPSYCLKFSKNDLRLAALLHDIGQACIPDGTIDKAGKLSESEKNQVKQHPEASVALLECMEGYDRILDGVRYHHERIDGRGYYGLKGKEIPIIARILAILDTFSAVTVLKTYKPARTYEDGITTLKLGSGSQFDAELVNLFVAIPKSRVIACGDEVRERIKNLSNKGFTLL